MAELFDRYCADSTSVEANVAAAVVRATAATAGPAQIDTIIAKFQDGDTPQEELRFLYALAEVRDPEQMARVLDLAMTPAVRTQNAPVPDRVVHRQPRQRVARPGGSCTSAGTR